MITKDSISNWLKAPHQLQEVSPRALLQLAKEYPYFIVAHYMKFAGVKPDKSALPALLQAHPVNPILLHEWLRQGTRPPEMAQGPKETQSPPILPKDEKKTADEPALALGGQEDYFAQQGIHVPYELPPREIVEQASKKERSLLVVMTFAEWLGYIQSKSQEAKEEEEAQKALKTMWQKQKLAAAIEEEEEEIPEQVFEMAVNSISRQEDWVSESFAEVYAKQGKREKAIDMYKKLILLNPEKNAYFAAKIETLQKDINI